jgi:tagaturonate reductase
MAEDCLLSITITWQQISLLYGCLPNNVQVPVKNAEYYLLIFIMEKLNKEILTRVNNQLAFAPDATHLALPEKVIQFGTGVLLRGLPDFFIDKANKAGVFNGRVVMIKSTSSGNDASLFASQDMLYTQCVRGIREGAEIKENWINASISRILSAKDQWDEVLACAENPDIRVIISNTTEAGLQLSPDDNPNDAPPRSFPAKLLALLYHRFTHTSGDKHSGFVILPTELVSGNGGVLKGMLLHLANTFYADQPAFLDWVVQCNVICNTLVDRIVPGALPAAEYAEMEATLGYSDSLMIMSEAYSLWAIEREDEAIDSLLSFSTVNPEVVLCRDIHRFKELKLRLLNGTHTMVCALAIHYGFVTVKEAMADEDFNVFIKALTTEEIARSVVDDKISYEDALTFASSVLDRFRNPFLNHKWQSIAFQYAEKMKMRNIPVLNRYRQVYGTVPERMAFGFAAFLLLLRELCTNSLNSSDNGSKSLSFEEKNLGYFSEVFAANEVPAALEMIMKNAGLWGSDFCGWTEFHESVLQYAGMIEASGAARVMKGINAGGVHEFA